MTLKPKGVQFFDEFSRIHKCPFFITVESSQLDFSMNAEAELQIFNGLYLICVYKSDLSGTRKLHMEHSNCSVSLSNLISGYSNS